MTLVLPGWPLSTLVGSHPPPRWLSSTLVGSCPPLLALVLPLGPRPPSLAFLASLCLPSCPPTLVLINPCPSRWSLLSLDLPHWPLLTDDPCRPLLALSSLIGPRPRPLSLALVAFVSLHPPSMALIDPRQLILPCWPSNPSLCLVLPCWPL